MDKSKLRYYSRPHTLSPSSWNRYETCARQYWLSRQGLPRKTGMAAVLGTAVHESIEDLIGMDISDRTFSENNWLPSEAEKYLRNRWEKEKKIFFKTPRRPNWKEENYENARVQQKGAINILLSKTGVPDLPHTDITVALWKRVQSLVLACEGELKSSDGKLMGRLDLLLAKVDQNGKICGWVVADLKTGRPPDKELKPTVRRQLLLYRDLLLENNPKHPPVSTEGWYTSNATVYSAEGESVLPQAYAAWEATQPSMTPLPPTTSEDSCGGFCDYKAWCPHWWMWRKEEGTLYNSTFSDAVVLLERVEIENGIALLELCEPANIEGRVIPTGRKVGAIFEGLSLENIRRLVEEGWQGAVFIGSVKIDRDVWRVGEWCDVLPWQPIPDQFT